MKRYYLVLLLSIISSSAFWGSGGYPDAVTDSVGGTYEYEWDTVHLSHPLGTKKGIMCGGYGRDYTYQYCAQYPKQRVFYALPFRLSSNSYPGNYWGYNDANGINSYASDSNNTYDANDMSPFSLYP